MYYAKLKNIVRDETLSEKTRFILANPFHYKIKSYELEAGASVIADYSIELSLSTPYQDQTQQISNTIRTYIILYGDEDLSCENLTEFIEKNLQIAIEDLRIFKIFKQYTDGQNLKEYTGISKSIKVYPPLTDENIASL